MPNAEKHSAEFAAEIADLKQAIKATQTEQRELEQQIASKWNEDTTDLTRRYAENTAKLNAAPLRLEQLERLRIEAEISETQSKSDALLADWRKADKAAKRAKAKLERAKQTLKQVESEAAEAIRREQTLSRELQRAERDRKALQHELSEFEFDELENQPV